LIRPQFVAFAPSEKRAGLIAFWLAGLLIHLSPDVFRA
jgi:hypothetical protein